MGTSRRSFLRGASAGALALAACGRGAAARPDPRPNILFALADDWSWPQSHGLDDPVLEMPTYERLAREGVVFRNAYVSSPSCTPSRGAMLTGQYHWRLEQGGNLWSILPAKFAVYPDLLEAAGYHVGFCRKGWGPGNERGGGRKRNPAGNRYKDFRAFLAARPRGAPFCFWFGSHDPHRGYSLGSGARSGMDPQRVKLPACLPDARVVRSDLCDYYWKVQRFDRETGQLVAMLERAGELDNTIVVMSGDNGLPFPRCKSNLYDTGTRVPLVVMWRARARGGRVVEDFVSMADLAPTFLEAAGLKPLPEMTARSFLDVLLSDKEGQVDPRRDHVLTGMERHAWARPGGVGYPMRAIRTADFLYIRNFKPERWPAGDPPAYRDIDGSPTKNYMLAHRDDPRVRPLFRLAFEKRPPEELYDLRRDPGQLHNVADDPAYAQAKARLAERLTSELKATADPRALGKGGVFDTYPYLGRRPPGGKR